MSDPAPPIVSATTHDISAIPKKSPEDQKQERRLREIQFYAGLAFAFLFMLVPLWAAFWLTDPKVNEWGRSILSLILGGVIGIVFFKK